MQIEKMKLFGIKKRLILSKFLMEFSTESFKYMIIYLRKTVRDEARNYLAKFCSSNAKDLNLKTLREKGFKKEKEEESEEVTKKREAAKKVKETKELPGLIVSSNESASER